MASPHLGRMIPWNNLLNVLRKEDPSSIVLPIGECGKIHCDEDSSTKIQVKNRKFITEDMICTDSSCQTTNVQSFSKKKAGMPDLIYHNQVFSPAHAAQIEAFVVEFNRAASQFADTEAKKYSAESIAAVTPPTDEYLEGTIRQFDGGDEDDYRPAYVLLYSLIVGVNGDEDIKILLHLNHTGALDIRTALSTCYGGQSVGQGMPFLLYHLIRFYLTCNVIIACEYQRNPGKWGSLSPNASFKDSIQHDCDFFTFIPQWRSYLHEDVFMVDLEQTKDLLKKCFRFIYIIKFLCERVDYDGGYFPRGNIAYRDVTSCFADR
jgi:hypothetical protein